MVDALSRRHVLLNTMNNRLLEFEYIKVLSVNDSNFEKIYNACECLAFGKFYRMNG